MSESSDPSRLSGLAQKATGAVKETMGSMFGSEETKLEGTQQKVQGDQEYTAAQKQQHDEGGTDRLSGMAREAKGRMTDDPSEARSGLAQEAKGMFKQGTSGQQ
jgi:uncharacterized protein YjbJ (UPF0337 family)